MKQTKRLAAQAGFTLIEILIVIGIIAILAAIVLVAVNPAKQFEKANNAQRSSNVNAILNAVGQYAVDNKGDISGLGSITSTPKTISKSGGVDICSKLVSTYIAGLPGDPTDGTSQNISDCSSSYDTGYEISKDTNNRITISAPHAQNATISVTR